VSTDDLTGGVLPPHISTPAAGVPPRAPAGAGDALRANRIRTNLVVPVDVSGNAVAAGGDASATNHSHQSAGRTGAVLAGWDSGPVTGNAVEADHAAPVQVTGNAVSVAGTATTFNDADQSATTGGDTTTGGAGRTLAGNVLAEQGATPVQVDGNAIAAAGRAHAQSTTDSAARSDGTIGTSGAHGTGSGNVGAIPLAVPAEVTNLAVSGVGNASSTGQNTVTAQGGDNTRPTWRGPSYVATDGDPATLSGNAAVPGVANPAELTCDAAGVIGNSDTECGSVNKDTAGGVVDTKGSGSTGSGNLATVPVSEPAEVFGNGVAAVGNANSGAGNTDNSTALGNAFTVGDGSALSANEITAPVAGANDLYANGASAVGNAAGTADNTVASTAGGYAGTTGDGATGSGNIGQLPVAAPVEVFGSTGSLAGTARGTVPDEEKTVRAGGSPNGRDDRGTASSNVVTAPTALPAQVFGAAAGAAANTSSVADNTSTVYAGGDPTATGRSGTASGDIVQLATATPAQAFQDGASVLGNGWSTGANDTTVGSGGTATANGSDGTIAGDVVNVPDAGPLQAFGVAAASPGNEEADSLNNTYTTAGDDTVTNGDRGVLAGDVATAQVTQVEQVLAAGLAGAGNSTANGFTTTATRSGGDVVTSGEWGALSGDLVDVPATDVTQAPADGIAALGNQWAFAHSTTSAASGGTSRTAGAGFLDGTPVVAPAGVNTTVYRVPVEILGRAVEEGHHTTSITDDDTAPRLNLPVGAFGDQPQFGPSDQVDGLLGANQVPGIATLFTAPGPRGPIGLLDLQHTQVLPVVADNLPATQVFPAITDDLPAAPETTQQLPALTGTRVTQAMPVRRVTPYQPYVPMTGELPVGGALPIGAVPVSATLPTVTNAHLPSVPTGPATQSAPAAPPAPGLPAIPDLPPVPTLPAMPTLPGRAATQDLPAPPALPINAPQLNAPSLPTLPTPHVSGPVTGGLPTAAGRPSTQYVPTAPAPRLMAQLRGLIDDLENVTGGNRVHPMSGFTEPDVSPATALLPELPVDGFDFEPPVD
jgi:hypothetical protein